MNISFIGLGKMGLNLCRNLREKGHKIKAYDIDQARVDEAKGYGIEAHLNLKDILFKGRNTVIIMIPPGQAVSRTIDRLIPILSIGDIIIDAGNSNFKNSIDHHRKLARSRIDFLDCGTSGGPRGALEGACMMVGGDSQVFRACEEIFRDASVEGGYLHTGEVGSGHFVKMIHNAIEYGMIQSIAEGFGVLEKSQYDLDFEKVASIWNKGSVIQSWLMERLVEIFREDRSLETVREVEAASGDCRWTVEAALELNVPAPVIALSLMMRYGSSDEHSFAEKIVTGLKNKSSGYKLSAD